MQRVEPGKPSVPRGAKRRSVGKAPGSHAGANGAAASRPRGKAARAKGSGARSSRSPEHSSTALAAAHAGHASQLTPEIETELAGIAAGAGCELLHVEWKGGVLRLILDRAATAVAPPISSAPACEESEEREDSTADLAAQEGAAAAEIPAAAAVSSGVSLGDCEYVAKVASAMLDVLDFGGGRYVLEVSSPGLDRQLYRPSDYRRFFGRLARVTYEAAGAEGRTVRRTIVARLGECEEGTVILIDERTGERLTLRLDCIRLARLEVEL